MSNIVTRLSYGVYVVSSLDGSRLTGCIANCAMQITAEPPTFAISINHDNFTHRCIKETGKFAVSVLAQESEPSIIRTFGFKSGEDTNKFDSVEYVNRGGLPVVKDSCGFLVCKVINAMETATHTVFLGELVESDVFDERTPMTYDYYHKVIKGSAPKKAPTYIPPSAQSASPKKKRKFVCSVCGYEYEGEELPSDFICPLCGVGADMFNEVES